MVGFLLPLLLVGYLGIREGGYDAVVRGEVGVAVWWLVVLGVIVGLLPRRVGRIGWIAVGAFAAFGLWTGLGILWSESAGRSADELARVATLLGIFVLALTAQGAGALRRTVAGVAVGVSLIGLLALASRLQPSWFPANEVAEFLPTERSRLNYPLAYWNGLAELIAIGLPLLLWAASSTKLAAGRALATAVLPALLLTMYFTLSRGGALAVLVAVAVLVALHPRRLALAVPGILGAIGGAVLIALASRRSELTDGLVTEIADRQGNEMTLIAVGVCLIVGLLAYGFALAERRGVVSVPAVGLRKAGIALGGAAAVVLVAFIALGGPGRVADGWDEFKQPVTPGDDAERFESASGSGRYQWWDSAIEANASEPLVGIGPGTFEFWFARSEVELLGPVRDAHSLYLETLGELGVVGLLLLVGLIGMIIYAGLRGVLVERRTDPGHAALLAASLAAAAAFLAAAAIDFAWEVTVLSATFLLLGAAMLAPRSGEAAEAGGGRGWVVRVGLGLLAVAGLAAIIPPLISASEVRDSQTEVRSGDLAAALDSARTAQDFQPFAAQPELQEALVLELAGDLDGALAAAREATENEPTNWENWLLLSRVQAELGMTEESTESFLEAESLNPRSPLFD